MFLSRFQCTMIFLCILWIANASNAVQFSPPKGYLLVLKVVQDPIWADKSYNHASMFKVGFDGSMNKWWNVSFDENVGPLSYGAFAFDAASETVYLPTVGQITGISQNGKIMAKAVNKQNHQYFWNYYYESKSKTFVGVCSDDKRESWSWCQVNSKSGTLSRSAHRLPYTDGPNGLDQLEPLYTIDFNQQLIWYKPYLQDFLTAANYMTGETVFVSGQIDGASCIAHNPLSNKTYILKGYDVSQYYRLAVFELLPKPNAPKEILKLIDDSRVIISIFGSCDIVPKANMLYVFMTNVSASLDNLMPTDLVLVDLSIPSYKQIPLDYKQWQAGEVITGVKYIPA